MTTNNNLDALFADAELPFGHPGRRFDDTPEYFGNYILDYPETPAVPPGPGVMAFYNG